MKAAITGASGHVGNVLCESLIEKSVQVRALVHEFRNELDQLDLEIVEGNILNEDDLERLVDGVDVVFHLAAKISIDNKHHDEIFRINVEGTRNLVNACKKKRVHRLIHFSTIHTLLMTDVNELIDETKPLVDGHLIAYEHSKAEAERLVLKAIDEGLDAVILNPTAIIGPYDYKRSYLGQALIRIYLNRIPMLIRGGYDFTDVRDVVDGAIKAAEKGRKGERYLLPGKWVSLADLSKMIAIISGGKTPTYVAHPVIARLGLPFIQMYAKMMREEPLYTTQSLYILKHSGRNISGEKAGKELGYSARPLEETLIDTFDWYKRNGML